MLASAHAHTPLYPQRHQPEGKNSLPLKNSERDRLLRKIDQEYEMAGLARQDGDTKDEARRYELIAEYKRQLKET